MWDGHPARPSFPQKLTLPKAIATLINYEEWKRLKQVEMELMNEDNENFYTVEEVIAEYNQIHGTKFTLENLKNG